MRGIEEVKGGPLRGNRRIKFPGKKRLISVTILSQATPPQLLPPFLIILKFSLTTVSLNTPSFIPLSLL